MSVMFGGGLFEASLRKGKSTDNNCGSLDRKFLHKCCSGSLHGYGVKKERTRRAVVKSCSIGGALENHQQYSSDDESVSVSLSRSLSSDCSNRLFNSSTISTKAKVKSGQPGSVVNIVGKSHRDLKDYSLVYDGVSTEDLTHGDFRKINVRKDCRINRYTSKPIVRMTGRCLSSSSSSPLNSSISASSKRNNDYAFGSRTSRFDDERKYVNRDLISSSSSRLVRSTSNSLKDAGEMRKSSSNLTDASSFCIEGGRTYKSLSDLTKGQGQKFEDKVHQLQAKTDKQINDEKAFLDATRLWVIHKGGFSGAIQVKQNDAGKNVLEEGKIFVKLDYNGKIIEVDEVDVERANPVGFERVEDLAQLRFLNESSVLYTLRQRFSLDLIHTYAGPTMILFNPMGQLAIYSEKVVELFRHCKLEDMPPHVYSVAETAHRKLLSTRQDQSIVLLGRSGSGKTMNTFHILRYYSLTTTKKSQLWFKVEKIQAICTIMEAFGHTRTVLNSRSSRISQMYTLHYDTTGYLMSVSLEAVLLDRSRVGFRPEYEPNFNVFYQLLAGIDSETRNELFLNELNEPCLFMTPLKRLEETSKAITAWKQISESLRLLEISKSESNCIWSILAAIFHLGVASYSSKVNSLAVFSKSESALKAAKCLGVSVDELFGVIFQFPVEVNSCLTTYNQKYSSNLGGTRGEVVPHSLIPLDRFVCALYQEAFSAIVHLINRSLGVIQSGNRFCSIIILDTPGFQNPATVSSKVKLASFDDLCFNYLQERLQLLFYQRTVISLHDKYQKENILCDTEPETTEVSLVDIIDNQSNGGLFWLLDEMSMLSGSPGQFVQRLLERQKSSEFVRSGPDIHTFVLMHFNGTNPVIYNAEEWVEAIRSDHQRGNTIKNLTARLSRNSSKGILSNLFAKFRGGYDNCFDVSTENIKMKHSHALQIKSHVDELLKYLDNTCVHFIHFFLPQHNAALSDIIGPQNAGIKSSTLDRPLNDMNIPLVRSQLRGAQIIEAVRLHKNGFPESLGFSEFWRRFHLLSPDFYSRLSINKYTFPDAQITSEFLAQLDLFDSAAYRIGTTEIFFRSGVLSHLEQERNQKLNVLITAFQARAKGVIARQRFHVVKTNDTAVRCIQRNVRIFFRTCDWSWWKLLIKITPLLNIYHTENQLKAQTEELSSVRQNLLKVEEERNNLSLMNRKLEKKLSDLVSDLSEESLAASLANERLHAEQNCRLRMQKEREEIEIENRELRSASHRMLESDLLIFTPSNEITMKINGQSGGGEAEYRQKYERVFRELNATKKLILQQQQDSTDQLTALKKQLEKKLSDALDEIDTQRQNAAQWKRKSIKAQNEVGDAQLLLEKQTSRNALLEKKQRKFDNEISSLAEALRLETVAREKVARDLELSKDVRHKLEDQLQAMKLDLDFNEEKIITLNKELEELHHGENNFEEITSLKRQKHDLEIRFKDQEEELDDLAGQIQLLECAKTKLEMSVVAMKKEHRRELSCKEDELEDARSALQKKVKALEQQLETEHEERIRYARDKRELESKLMNLQEMASHSTDEEIVFRLRKDVKRLKVLLRDAQGIAERSNHETPNRVMLRQLKNQLEDAEFGRNAALKARQNADLELSDVQQQLEEILRSKSDLEDRLQRLNREKADLAGRVEDNEEELSDVMKKYKAAVSQMSVDQITLQEQKSQIIDLEDERTRLREQLTDQSRKIECLEGESVSNLTLHRLTLKVRECEAKLELEMTTRNRLNAQITRLKEFIEKLNGECDSLRLKEQNGQDTGRRLQRQIRELREEFATAQARETEATSKRNEVEKKLELVEAENISTKSDLKLALKRIEELQVAISAEIDSDSALSEDEDGGSDVGREISDYSYDERNDLQSFMENHQRACSIQREREKSLFKDVQPCIPLEGQAAKPVMMIHDSEKGGEETESHA